MNQLHSSYKRLCVHTSRPADTISLILFVSSWMRSLCSPETVVFGENVTAKMCNMKAHCLILTWKTRCLISTRWLYLIFPESRTRLNWRKRCHVAIFASGVDFWASVPWALFWWKCDGLQESYNDLHLVNSLLHSDKSVAYAVSCGRGYINSRGI